MRFIFCIMLITILNQATFAEDDDSDSSSEPSESSSDYTPMTQEQCTPIDLRGVRCADGSNRLPALRSQGMTNYCFAFATTEILSYATCRHLSALSSGLLGNLQNTAPLKDPANPINLGGNPRQLVNTLHARGPCLESAFPSSPLAIRPDERAKNSPAPSPSGFDFLMSFYNRRNSANPLNCQSQDVRSVRLNSALPTPLTNSNLRQAINTALEDKQQPAGVHVNSAIALDNSATPSERPEQVATDHYVNIVGRQWVNGHCHYMFRDQNPMRGSPWPRVPNNPNQATSELSDDYFYIWVREENLLNNIDDVIYNAN